VTDPQELAALRARRPEAVAKAVREHAAVLLRAALGLGHGLSEAEELVQASFAAFLERLPSFEGRSSVRTYLFGILYNKALEAGRKRSRELAVDPADEVFDGRFDGAGHWSRAPLGPDQEADAAETARLLAACLAGLPPQQRAAFQLKEVEGLDSLEACNALGVESTHLRVLMFRARAKLRECLERSWEGRR
jgi:RNA polymerase sigma-70 factor (ECF subfamily)